ncbi:hypothetical protein HYT25_00210 [Candidatus Pacearchaeota archaeon]|nr:hypothetical protein [Candidatus Pacearchaeota archaeon]
MPSTYERLSLSKQQKKFVLLGITKELIRNSGGYFYTLERMIKDKELATKETANKKHETLAKVLHDKDIAEGGKILKREMEKENQRFSSFPHETLEKEKKFGKKPLGAEEIVNELRTERYEPSLKPIQPRQEKFHPPLGSAKLFIPEEKLPAHLEYLKPIPTGSDVDVGKLNPLVKDPQVNLIECPGPDGNITVSGSMGTKSTGISLSRDEISDIIDRFSKASKIPVHEGVFKVVVGRLIFMAIVSEIIGSRFTIKKMFAEIPTQLRR